MSTHGKPVKPTSNDKFTSNDTAQRSKESQSHVSRPASQGAIAEEENKEDVSVASGLPATAAIVNKFENIIETIIENQYEFAMYVADESEYGFFYHMPADLGNKLSNFEKILLIRCLKPEKVLFAVQKYLELELGPEYAISPVSSMETLFRASLANNPIIFVLSQGVDPMQQVRNYAEREGMSEKLKIMSLGSNQGAQASRLISTG